MCSRCSKRWRTNTSLLAAKSAEAYALLYEAATHNVQIQRVMKKHKGNFPLAFAGVSHYVTGNLKTAIGSSKVQKNVAENAAEEDKMEGCIRMRAHPEPLTPLPGR